MQTLQYRRAKYQDSSGFIEHTNIISQLIQEAKVYKKEFHSHLTISIDTNAQDRWVFKAFRDSNIDKDGFEVK